MVFHEAVEIEAFAVARRTLRSLGFVVRWRESGGCVQQPLGDGHKFLWNFEQPSETVRPLCNVVALARDRAVNLDDARRVEHL